MEDIVRKLSAMLASLPERSRLELIKTLLPPGHVVVPARCDGEMERRFVDAAKRIHGALRSPLTFDRRAVSLCWQATLNEGAGIN